jgi:hypothetical protein
VSDFLPANAPITRSELSAILDLPAALTDEMVRDGPLTLRDALRGLVLANLAMLPVEPAFFIATCCAAEAEAGGHRMLAVTWTNGTPAAEWVDQVTNALRQVAVLIPAERFFTELASRLVHHRTTAQRPN